MTKISSPQNPNTSPFQPPSSSYFMGPFPNISDTIYYLCFWIISPCITFSMYNHVVTSETISITWLKLIYINYLFNYMFIYK